MNKCKNALRIVTITLFVLILCTKSVFAFDLDMTVEDDIRKNYNSSQLVKDTKIEEVEDLPALPESLKNQKPASVKKVTSSNAPKLNVS